MKKLFSLLILTSVITQLLTASSKHSLSLKDGIKMEIEVCSDQIFRIKVTPKKDFDESLMERYELIKTDWDDVKYTEKTEGKHIVFSTGKAQLAINKETGVMTLKDGKGNVLVQNIEYLSSKNKLVKTLGERYNKEFESFKREGIIIGDTADVREKYYTSEVGDMSKNSILEFSLKEGERLYGGGSTSRDHIQHRGEILRMWATYQKAELPVPFMMSSEGWGVFNNTTKRNYFDMGVSNKDEMYIYNTSEGADFYLMTGDSMYDILAEYTTITGRAYVLPKYAYGLAFGGHKIEDMMDVMDDALRFRQEEVPCDIIWLEPQWMSKNYDFSTKKNWNYNKFPAEGYWEADRFPKKEHHDKFIGRLHKLGYKFALWLCINHDLSIEEEDALALANNQPLSGQEHWFDHLTKFIDQGVDGFKLDPGRTLDEHPDREYYNGYTDKEMHNLSQVLLPRQMLRTYRNHTGKRDFHHYCAGWAGVQKWTAAQSGDNGGGRTALFDQLNLSFSGLMNTSCDVMADDNELASLHLGVFMPWTQINSWFYLLHPWYFPENEKDIYRSYIQLRYDLLPYIYSTALQGNQEGKPILRSMPLVFPDDRNVDDMVYQYMFGDNLLVGVFSDSIYLPKGEWVNYWTNEKVIGEGKEIYSEIPEDKRGLLFVREGAIIPMQQPVQYIDNTPIDNIILKVYPKGKSSYSLYEDDGISYGYEEGKVAMTKFECDQTNNKTVFTIEPVSGSYDGMLTSRTYNMEVMLDKKPTSISINNKPVSDWDYKDGILHVTVNQPDVHKKVSVTIQ